MTMAMMMTMIMMCMVCCVDRVHDLSFRTLVQQVSVLARADEVRGGRGVVDWRGAVHAWVVLTMIDGWMITHGHDCLYCYCYGCVTTTASTTNTSCPEVVLLIMKNSYSFIY